MSSPVVNLLHWSTDEPTAEAATAQPLRMLPDVPAVQMAGLNIDTATWNRRVVQPPTWKDPLRSDPEEIIRQFQDGRFTQGLAMVVLWGSMFRQPEKVYHDGRPETIERIERQLGECAKSIQESHSIEYSWKALTGNEDQELRWTAVMTSKTLHFLCRSLGYAQNPPVPIDGAVIRNRLWPLFRYSVPFGHRPGNWEGDSFDAYCRYMTAIRTWADQRHWTTTQMETTTYEHFSQP